MARAFRALGNVKVQGLPVRAIAAALHRPPPAFSTAVEAQGIDALYVSPGLDADVPAIIEVSRRRKVITMASRHEQVQRGLSLGVFADRGKPTIVVNLAAAKSEGAAFGSDLLRLANVIR